MKILYENRWIHYLLIVFISILAYSNTFNVPFHFDDPANIVYNPVVKDITAFLKPFESRNLFSDPDYNFSLYTAFKARYIGYLTFALNFKIHGLNLTGFHITNLIIHIITGLLLYWFILLVFKTPALVNSKEIGNSKMPALIASLLFVSHPVQTQAVTYIVQRLASLAAMFYLLALVLYVLWRIRRENGKGGMKSQALLYACAFISTVLGMKTKETTFTLPIVIFLFELMFFRGDKGRFKYTIPFLFTLAIIPLGMFFIDAPLGGFAEKTKVTTDLNRTDYLLTEFVVIATYLRLLFLPINQVLWYDFPVYSTLLNVKVLMSLLLHISLLSTAFYIYFRYKERRPLLIPVSFGTIFFYTALSVESSVIPIRDVIFEHRLYLPSIGAFTTISIAGFIFSGKINRRALVLAPVVIIMALTIATYKRNLVWKDKISMWEDVVKKSPALAYPHCDLGAAYFKDNRLEEAIRELNIAKKIKYNLSDAYYNLGIVYVNLDRLDEAIGEFKMAIKFDPDYAEAHHNLGVVYKRLKKYEEAVLEFKTALRNGMRTGVTIDIEIDDDLHPSAAVTRYNLGSVYKLMGEPEKAEHEFKEALKIRPDYVGPHYLLGKIYTNQNRLDEAVAEFQWALEHNYPRASIDLGNILDMQRKFGEAEKILKNYISANPESSEAHSILGRVFMNQERFKEAEVALKEAIDFNPDNFDANQNIGVLYAIHGFFDAAITHFEKALSLRPDDKNLKRNLDQLYEEMRRKMTGN